MNLRPLAPLSAFAVALAAAMLTALPALAQRFEDHPGFWHPASGWGHMVFGGLMMIIFWGGVIALIVMLIRWLGHSDRSSHGDRRHPSPLEILDERYARGEIEREEYRQRRQDLTERERART